MSILRVDSEYSEGHRILFVMNHYPDSRNGGIENVTYLLSEQLKAKGYRIHVLFLYHTPFDHSDDTLFECCEYIEPSQVGQKVGELVRQAKIEAIVNRCVILASPIIRQAIEGTSCKLITTYNNRPTLDARKIQDIWFDNDIGLLAKCAATLAYPWYKNRSIQRLKQGHQQSYETSDYTVLLSTLYVPEYAAYYGVNTEKMVVINNPIKSGVAITEEEFAAKEKTVLMVTRLDEAQKCVIKALKVWKNVARCFPDWKLQIVGGGPDETKIKAFSATENIPRVEYIPACNPAEYYKKASLFLMSSRNEGWPNTLNEAMRYGCVPIVLATFSAIYEIIDNGSDGFIIEPKSEEEDVICMTASLSAQISDTNSRQLVARAAIDKTQRLSIENIVPKWERLFGE